MNSPTVSRLLDGAVVHAVTPKAIDMPACWAADLLRGNRFTEISLLALDGWEATRDWARVTCPECVEWAYA